MIALLFGCTGASKAQVYENLAKNQPEIQQFLEQYPNATIRVVYLDENAFAAERESFESECDRAFELKPYYKVVMNSSEVDAVTLIEEDSERVVCALVQNKGMVGQQEEVIPPLPEEDTIPPFPEEETADVQAERNTNIDLLMDDDPKLGSDDAPIVMVEFSDFQCPFCKRYYEDSYKQLKSEYVDTGKVQLVFRDFPLTIHENAKSAAIAAECAQEQGKWETMHDMLFEKQENWAGGNGRELFISYAKNMGLDVSRFETCYGREDIVEEIRADFDAGLTAGVAGTPTFFIGKRGERAHMITGAQPYSQFKEAIEELGQ